MFWAWAALLSCACLLFTAACAVHPEPAATAGSADRAGLPSADAQLAEIAAGLAEIESEEAEEEPAEERFAARPGRPVSHTTESLPRRKREMCCQPRQFWVVNTRCAPACNHFDQGLDRITYWREEGENNWVEYSREDFLLAMDPSAPVTFYVHGNTLKNEQAINGARRIYHNVGRGVPAFRLVLWSWPAERIKHLGIINNFVVKADYSDYQGYYMAWLVDQIDPRVAVSLTGHSYGARTVLWTLQGLATGRLFGHDLPPRQHEGRRPMQGALICPALENCTLLPGCHHDRALTQVDRMLITVNPDDHTLHTFSRIIHAPVLGVTGVALRCLPSEQRAKVVEVFPTAWAGKAHRFSRYANSPEIADLLRPYMIYRDPPAVAEEPGPTVE